MSKLLRNQMNIDMNSLNVIPRDSREESFGFDWQGSNYVSKKREETDVSVAVATVYNIYYLALDRIRVLNRLRKRHYRCQKLES